MTRYVALLRSVNVGGTGKLAMSDLRDVGEAAGFTAVATYIASGNLLLTSETDAVEVARRLKGRLAARFGRPITVMVRSAAEIAGIVTDNPFPDTPGARVAAYFLDGPAERATLAKISGLAADEEIQAGGREVYVRFGSAGMGRSKLRLPAEILAGTARNMNTVAALAKLASG